ncbi:unnamed protein product [Caenorhabditis sp. 36 PRJEB53466]|nr:unnamed protein product [Caenorhabditis sp. 36 PRJEB53466]
MAPRKTQKNSADDETYEVERIVDHVDFLHAYKRYYKYNDDKYKDMFKEKRNSSNLKDVFVVSKVFYQVKWLKFSTTHMTWEPEHSLADLDTLGEYKQINNLPRPVISLKIKPGANMHICGSPYEAPEVLSDRVDIRIAKLTEARMNNLHVFLHDEYYNAKFGLVKITQYKWKWKKRYGLQYCKAANDIVRVKDVDLTHPHTECNDIPTVVQAQQKTDRSFLQLIIKHENILKMRDCFFVSNGNVSSKIRQIYNWSHQSLRQRIREEKKADWKKVCRDMLNAFSYIHTNGIHQAVSLDSIMFNSNGTFQLSGFKDFTFSKSIPMNEVKSYSIELAPRKFGLRDHFISSTVDLYALGIVLLQCTCKRNVFPAKLRSVDEMEQKIKKAMDDLETDDDRHFVKLLIRAREHIHNGSGTWRFSSQSLLAHPVLAKKKKMMSVDCYYLHSPKAQPIKDRVFFTSTDTAQEAYERHVDMYHEPGKKTSFQYLLVCSDNFARDRSSTVQICDEEDFKFVAEEDVGNQKKQLLILPTILTPYRAEENEQDFLVLYRQEFGCAPIIVKGNKLTDAELTRQLKRYVIPSKFRGFDMKMFSRRNSGEQKTSPVKFTLNEYILNLVPTDGRVIENRFEVVEERARNGLSAKELEWKDVAGCAQHGIQVDVEENGELAEPPAKKQKRCKRSAH